MTDYGTLSPSQRTQHLLHENPELAQITPQFDISLQRERGTLAAHVQMALHPFAGVLCCPCSP